MLLGDIDEKGGREEKGLVTALRAEWYQMNVSDVIRGSTVLVGVVVLL